MTLHADPTAAAAPADSPDPQLDHSKHARPRRSYATIGLLVLSALLMSLSFAPLGQFYLAWISLVPLLLVIRNARSSGTAFLWGWVGGSIFFYLNLSYLMLVTI